MPKCLQQYLRSLFCHDITNFNANNSENYVWGEYICGLLVLFHRGENKQAAGEINPFPSLKLSRTRNTLKQHTTFLTELGMIKRDTLSQRHSLH